MLCLLRFISVCFLAVTLTGHQAKAELFVFQNLSFGKFIVSSNNAQYGITVDADGSYNYSDHFIEISPPRPGIYEIDGLQPNSVINVIVTQLQPMIGNGNYFDLTNFQAVHGNTSPSGVASITIGATALTSGNGLNYTDLNYKGQVQIQISY